VNKQQSPERITNSKPIPHIPLPFKEVIADVLKVKPPIKAEKTTKQGKRTKPSS
jgi:hypothetical protein